jgi:hypothetical protein
MTSATMTELSLPFPRVGEVDLPVRDGSVRVASYRARLAPWTGPRLQLERTRSREQLFAHRGRPLFAELAVLRRLQDAGFRGVWVDAEAGAMRTDLPGVAAPVTLPPDRAVLLARIAARRGRAGGLWSLLAWRDDESFFLHCRTRSADRLADPQLEWASAALGLGIDPSALGVIDVSVDAAGG